MNARAEGPIVDGKSTAVAEAAELGRRLAVAEAKPQVPPIKDGAPYIVLRDADGKERVEWLEETVLPPYRKTGTVKLNDAESFIAYYGTHGNGAPVYATLQPARFLAVLNDHTKDAAGWQDYRADFTVKHSKEYEVWTKHNGKGAAFGSNEAFAIFLEENAPDIVKPDPTTMLAIALNFRVNSDVAFSVAQRLEDGHIDFGYRNVVNATATSQTGGKLKIPEQFVIEVPVWDGLTAKKYRIEARFRYRLNDGKLALWYELVRPHKVVELAFKDLWEQIVKATKAPILHGTPS